MSPADLQLLRSRALAARAAPSLVERQLQAALLVLEVIRLTEAPHAQPGLRLVAKGSNP